MSNLSTAFARAGVQRTAQLGAWAAGRGNYSPSLTFGFERRGRARPSESPDRPTPPRPNQPRGARPPSSAGKVEIDCINLLLHPGPRRQGGSLTRNVNKNGVRFWTDRSRTFGIAAGSPGHAGRVSSSGHHRTAPWSARRHPPRSLHRPVAVTEGNATRNPNKTGVRLWTDSPARRLLRTSPAVRQSARRHPPPLPPASCGRDGRQLHTKTQ